MDYEERIATLNEEIDNLIIQRDDYIEEVTGEINGEIAALERKRDNLKREAEAGDKWTEEGLRERLRRTILSRYGSVHNIKLVKLWLNEAHIDGYVVYKPVLIILDKNVDEMNHSIDLHDFYPSESERDDFMETGGVIPSSVTLRFE